LGAHAQVAAFPTKPIRLLVGTVPGTLVDQVSRLYADKMSTYLKQPVVVENVSGASSLLAVRQVLKSTDGYTLLGVANTLVTVPHVSPKSGYAVKDFAAIGEMVRSPVVLVTGGSSPYKSLAELIAAAKKEPGHITYGSSGVGTTNHLAVELLSRQAGVSFSHVPYKGITAAVPDVSAGRVGFLAGTATSVSELMKTGALRALAISSDKRSHQFPDLPTLKELGYPGATYELWVGVVATAGIPRAAKDRLAEAMEAARNDPDVVKRLEAAGQEISAVRTPAQFDTVLRTDEEKFRKLIKDANIVAD
jgi:tripartite-type tricarboxylate transporter receptor subunit TctC